ncbi:hypothetical protein TWF696_009684 [Orbilia brochopaga]|uniref:Uncharacterized protein n=1 Tax=Orbilia brochopaga TaxID=3140254 RepID=A0AAV9UC10_9PEZI
MSQDKQIRRICLDAVATELPGEVQAQILNALSPHKIIRELRRHAPSYSIKMGMWRWAEFRGDQLIRLYEWNIDVLHEASQHPSGGSYVAFEDFRPSMIKSLRRRLQEVERSSTAKLPLNSFSIYREQIEELFESHRALTGNADGNTTNDNIFLPDAAIISFIEELLDRKRIIQDFCKKLNNLARPMNVFRGEIPLPLKEKPETSLLLFWLGMEHIASGNHKLVTSGDFLERWSDFQEYLDRSFDKDQAGGLLDEIATLGGELGVVIQMYCELVIGANPKLLPDIYNELSPKLARIDSLEGYAMYILSFGFERALLFLEQDPAEIVFLKTQDYRHIQRWKRIREALAIPDQADQLEPDDERLPDSTNDRTRQQNSNLLFPDIYI